MFGFIPAAGFGKRMGELTRSIPKPLLEINEGWTLLDFTIYQMVKLGIQDILINTHYLAESIHEDLEKKWKGLVNIYISWERDKILGTAGGITTSLRKFDKNGSFLSINPDTISFFSKPLFLSEYTYPYLFLSIVGENHEYTGLKLDNGKVRFEPGPQYFIGISILHSELFKECEKNIYLDLSDFFRTWSNLNILNGGIFDGKSYDLGDLEKWISWKNNTIYKNWKEDKNEMESWTLHRKDDLVFQIL